MKEIIEKVRNGDGLTDDELEDAIKFYKDLKEKLILLGRDFHLATVSVIYTLAALESFDFSRKNKL